uniref:Putative nuclease HARBI1 n=1 Tax=Salarias fasciatus TaxID=181472 RepID=A0A672H965_SALFA
QLLFQDALEQQVPPTSFIFDNKKQSGRPVASCRLNYNVPILRLWFNAEAELRQEFRLSRRAMQSLQRLLKRDLAHGLSYRVVSSVFSVPRSTVHRIVNKVARHIQNNLKKVIHFPRAEDLDTVGEGFGLLAGHQVFNNDVGAIDGCHIRIKPPQLHRLDYLNYKGFYSINMQAICDAEGRFLDIFVGYPGSVHDTRILKNSPFYLAGQYPPTGYFLLGDGGYPCLDSPIAVITPYKEPVIGAVQGRFNFRHSRARSVVERSFGIMKTRWRSTLFKALEVRPAFAPLVIATCAFLHNVCLDNGDLLEPDADVAQDIFDPQAPREGLAHDERSGSATRDRLAALLIQEAH